MNAVRLSLAALAFATPALAQDLANGDAIRSAIAGNTVQGSMAAAGEYTEFYTGDGAIKGSGYAGTWTVDGDKMCFSYGADPATCWNVSISGDQVTWLNNGLEEGTGLIVPGNPNNY